jgi:glutamate-1-semialdehyde 2,1-aminomutase
MAAGVATLRELTPEVYARLEEAGAALESGILSAAQAAGASVRISRVGSLLTAFVDAFPAFFHAMLDAGILLPPSQHEAWFVSAAHRDEQLDATIRAARDAFQAAPAEDR